MDVNDPSFPPIHPKYGKPILVWKNPKPIHYGIQGIDDRIIALFPNGIYVPTIHGTDKYNVVEYKSENEAKLHWPNTMASKPIWELGISHKPEVQTSNICTCATRVMASRGCPSARGKPCPNIQEL